MKKATLSPKMQKEMDRLLLDCAAAGSALKVRKALESGANVNGKDDTNWTALHIASYFQNAKICRMLIDLGAGVNAKTLDGATPLFIAASIGSVEVAEMLLDAGASPNMEDSIGVTPLMSAAERGNVEMANLLLSRGADPHARSEMKNKSALDFAIGENLPEVAAAIEAKILAMMEPSQTQPRVRARAM